MMEEEIKNLRKDVTAILTQLSSIALLGDEFKKLSESITKRVDKVETKIEKVSIKTDENSTLIKDIEKSTSFQDRDRKSEKLL